MKNLLEILSDPNRRCPMDTLEKCEQVLERMDFKVKVVNEVYIVNLCFFNLYNNFLNL